MYIYFKTHTIVIVDISIEHRVEKRQEGGSRAGWSREWQDQHFEEERRHLGENKSRMYMSKNRTVRKLRFIRDIHADSRIKSTWTVSGKVMAMSVDGQKVLHLKTTADVDYYRPLSLMNLPISKWLNGIDDVDLSHIAIVWVTYCILTFATFVTRICLRKKNLKVLLNTCRLFGRMRSLLGLLKESKG